MENKKIVPAWVGVVMFGLCAVSIYGCINLLSMNNGSNILITIVVSLFICATVLAVLYGILNYSKKAHWVFQVFSIIFLVALLISIGNVASESFREPLEGIVNAPAMPELPDFERATMPTNNDSRWVSTMVSAIMFACVFTLTIAKDLGKKKSYILILATMISALYFVIQHIAKITGFIYAISDVNVTVFILSLIYGIMIYAKYKDKEARGTK